MTTVCQILFSCVPVLLLNAKSLGTRLVVSVEPGGGGGGGGEGGGGSQGKVHTFTSLFHLLHYGESSFF